MTSPSVSSTRTNSGASTELPRRLGLWSAIAVLVGTTIGSGIFRSPAGIADKLPGPLPLMAVWATGGIFALCGALTLAELAGAAARPIDDKRGTIDYRRKVVGVLAKRAALIAFERAGAR